MRAERELAESQALVAELQRAEAARKAAVLEAAQEVLDKQGVVVEEQPAAPAPSGKRSIDAVEAEDEEEATELEEGRQIATNARALRPPPAASSTLETVRQAAWGALVFGVGVGATCVPVQSPSNTGHARGLRTISLADETDPSSPV